MYTFGNADWVSSLCVRIANGLRLNLLYEEEFFVYFCFFSLSDKTTIGRVEFLNEEIRESPEGSYIALYIYLLPVDALQVVVVEY